MTKTSLVLVFALSLVGGCKRSARAENNEFMSIADLPSATSTSCSEDGSDALVRGTYASGYFTEIFVGDGCIHCLGTGDKLPHADKPKHALTSSDSMRWFSRFSADKSTINVFMRDQRDMVLLYKVQPDGSQLINKDGSTTVKSDPGDWTCSAMASNR